MFVWKNNRTCGIKGQGVYTPGSETTCGIKGQGVCETTSYKRKEVGKIDVLGKKCGVPCGSFVHHIEDASVAERDLLPGGVRPVEGREPSRLAVEMQTGAWETPS